MKAMVAEPSPGVAISADGALDSGVTETGAEVAPVPMAFTARTSISYVVPLVKPVTATGEDAVPAEVHSPKPGSNRAK